MKESKARTVYRGDYTPPDFQVSKVELDVRLFEEETIVISHLKVKAREPNAPSPKPLVLDGEQMELLEIKLDGQPLHTRQYSIDSVSLTLPSVPDVFDLEIKVRIHPEQNTSLEGLYRSGTMFCTQCEAEGFRRITYFPDRPDVMACYRTRIEADSKLYPVLLSNGNPIDSGVLEEGRHWALWEDPFPKPAYLFAMVAGELECLEDRFMTQSNREVGLKIFVEPGNLDRTPHAMQSLKESMEWDERRFGREYDLDLFMIVAVDDFNFGAMENKGLNIFNSRLVLASPETATDNAVVNVPPVSTVRLPTSVVRLVFTVTPSSAVTDNALKVESKPVNVMPDPSFVAFKVTVPVIFWLFPAVILSTVRLPLELPMVKSVAVIFCNSNPLIESPGSSPSSTSPKPIVPLSETSNVVDAVPLSIDPLISISLEVIIRLLLLVSTVINSANVKLPVPSLSTSLSIVIAPDEVKLSLIFIPLSAFNVIDPDASIPPAVASKLI